jgi:hypothetical protein
LSSPSNCQPTDANGDATLSGLQATQDGISAAFSGYVTGIWPITPMGNILSWDVVLRSTTRIDNIATQMETTFNATLGAITFATYDGCGNSLAGVSVTTSAGGTVGYTDTTGDVSSVLTATTSQGSGFILGVAPGDVSLTFSAPGMTCARYSNEGWPGSGTVTTVVPISAGALTRASTACQ